MRILLIMLALVQFLIAALTSFTGAFADGAALWERGIFTIVHPVAAIGLLVLAVAPALKPAGLAIIRLLLALNIAADLALAALIYTGATRGDWWLPLLFAAIPVIGLGYSLNKKARA